MRLKSYLSLIVTTLAWGGNAVAGKLAIGHVSPMVLTFGRWLIAVLLIALISLPELRRDWPVIRRNLPLLFGYGIVGYALFNALLYSALLYTSAINVAIVQAGIPMLIFVFNFALFQTRVSLAQIAGFGLTLVGVLLIAAHGKLSTLVGLELNFGDALMLVAVTAYALYTIFLRYRPAIGWKSLMAVPALAAALASLPLVFWEVASGAAVWPDMQGMAVVLYTGLFASLVAQVLYIFGVEGIGANRAGLFINLVPVFGTLLSVAVLGERLETFHIAALVLALGGIAIAEWGNQKTG
ncbi:DMT family transporter [Gellertiella hungarica]|uniref:Drug/metabolite transporter (DMT)-like permease n=1 Tax=Gellertiella hungarica TaxID=1572859 RepID=A0A7W6NJ75_9HYPH|nr:DMT family transporter [Gellertiella hungarica]MBB4063189.1 drug/metabolite transporter (DMT)-like permease [Gellertiella hungarica]